MTGRNRRLVTAAFAVLATLAVLAIWRPGTAPSGPRSVTTLRRGVFRVPPERMGPDVLMLPGAVFLPPDPSKQLTSRARTNPGFVGSESCRKCHESYVDGAAQTAHALTARLPAADAILGSFNEGKNVLRTHAPELWFEMRKREDGVPFQRLVLFRDGEEYHYDAPIDIVFGSGKLGQTFLTWSGSQLYELPVSYLTQAGQWANSPGYTEGAANFARPIEPACVQCHATWWGHVAGTVNQYDKHDFLLGVTCETCHGPGRDHIAAAESEGRLTPSTGIVNPAGLNREQQLELCSQCHSGAGILRRAPFSYRPGLPLEDFLDLPPPTDSGAGAVHSANQRHRLELSRCFQNSPEMTCTTCHDPHRAERGDRKLFADRCRKCHTEGSCPTIQGAEPGVQDRCVDCHLPLQGDSKTGMATSGSLTFPELRDHHIRKEPAVSQKVLDERPQRPVVPATP